MKTRAACEATGLTRKSLLLYEEKGLISPKKVWSNGREYREYTEENIRELRQIATLRRALFTMDEIRRMKEVPDAAGEVFDSYYRWLLAQKEELEELVRAAEAIRRTGVSDLEALVAGLEQSARTLPLPRMDVHPRFRYLDEMEDRPPVVQLQTNFAEDGGNAGFWRLAMERKGGIRPVSYDDFFRGLGIYDYRNECENGTVASRVERDPKWMRRIKALFMGVAAFAGLMILLNWFGNPKMNVDHTHYWPWGWTWLCLGSGLVRGMLEYFTWHKQNKIWQQAEREKPRSSLRE